MAVNPQKQAAKKKFVEYWTFSHGFSPEVTECEVVSRLFDMYEKLTKEESK